MTDTTQQLRDLTAILHHQGEGAMPYGAVSPPIYQTSIFCYQSFDDFRDALADESRSYLYTRGNNPTVNLAEEKIAALERGERAKLVSSGAAAMCLAVLAGVEQGDHIIAVEDCYSWTRYLTEVHLRRFGVECSFVEGTRIEDFEEALRPNTRMILLESPATITFKLQDLREVAALARVRGIRTVIDNTWATPLFQNPLELGIDLVVHSASKYLGGNSDLVGGVIVGREEDIREIFRREFLVQGPVPDPLQAWLITRGMRTLHLRMPAHSANARKLTGYLGSHPKVEEILYPFHPSFPQYDLACRQMRGGSGLFSFRLKTRKLAEVKKFTDSLKYFKRAVSWGGYESLVFPSAVKWKNPEEIPEDRISLIRCHAGLEEAELLLEDLEQALEKMGD